jgi:hypothetical protein
MLNQIRKYRQVCDELDNLTIHSGGENKIEEEVVDHYLTTAAEALQTLIICLREAGYLSTLHDHVATLVEEFEVETAYQVVVSEDTRTV